MSESKEKKETRKQQKIAIKEKKADVKKAKKEVAKIKVSRRNSYNFGRLLNYFIYDRKGQPSKEDYKSKKKVEESIYPKGEPLGKYCKRFNWVHNFFKVIIFNPSLLILYKLMKKRLDSSVEDTWYNKNLKILDDAWKESMQIMSKYMCPTLPKAKSYEITRKMMLTIILNDSVTREFMNVLLHTITRRMQEIYKGKKDVYHVFYTDTVSYNPVYFTMVKAVMEQNKHPANVQVENLNKEERALYEEEQKLKKRRAEIIKSKHFIHMQQKAEEATKKELAQTVKPTVKSVFEPVPEGTKLELVPTTEQQTKKI